MSVTTQWYVVHILSAKTCLEITPVAVRWVLNQWIKLSNPMRPTSVLVCENWFIYIWSYLCLLSVSVSVFPCYFKSIYVTTTMSQDCYWVKKGLGWQNTLNHRVIAVLVSEGWINDELSKCSMKHWQCHGLAKIIQTFF